MGKLPQDYINFIAKGIVHNLKLEGLELKENYSEEDLINIFECKSLDELYKKINEIEEETLKALGLPIKEYYSLDELEQALNIKRGQLELIKSSFDNFPKF
ncbi:MAG: hypothetical protein KatS3mg068_2213 [Candidatus Sericytochromatia bacterium]|nr:MAG: hypothetical protein KatS3mg068_2213 [Candidatus Sericytochromatia bacterium]